MFSIFSRFHGSFHAARLAMKPGGRFEQRIDHAQVIGAQRRAGLRDFHDGVRELRHFHFRRAPGKFHARLHAVASRDIFRSFFTASVAMTFPSRSFTDLDRRIFGNGQHPAHAAEARLRINQLGDFLARPRRFRESSLFRSAPHRARRFPRSAPFPARAPSCIRFPHRRCRDNSCAN